MKKLILISVVHIVFLIGCSQKNESTASSGIAKSDQAMSRIDEKEIVKCSTIENQIQRLSCYDEFASRHGQVAISKHTDIANKGKWQIGSDVDPLTDKTVLHAQLIAESGKRKYGDEIVLTVRCKNGETETYINWSSFLGRDAIVATSRIDKTTAQDFS